jgi:hypothetical protein
MIAQRFGFTADFLMERNTDCISDDVQGSTSVAGGMEKVRPGTGRETGLGHAVSDLKKIRCGFKDQARARHRGEKCGLVNRCGLFLTGLLFCFTRTSKTN